MKLYIISLYLILVGTCRFAQSGSICRSNSIVPGRQVFISGYNNDIGQCECQITLTNNANNNDPITTNINIAHYPVGSNYSLFYWLRGYNNKIESTYKNSTFSLDFNGTLYVRIENHLIGSGELCSTFGVTTTLPDYNISATCENLTKTTETTTTTPSTSLSTTTIPTTTVSTTTTSTNTVPVNITPSVSQTVDTVSTGEIANTMSSSTTTIDIENKSSPTTIYTTDQGVARADSDNQTLLPIILGCSVGGTVLIILLIVIVGCVRFRRHKTKISSGNSHHGEMVEIKNNINVSSNSIPNNNNQHGTKYMAEMEIIPNDLYQSSDSLFDDPNESGQHEHVPEQHEQGTKDKPVMEIIPNDLYQSSDSLADDLNRLGHNPEQHAPGLGQCEHIPYTNPEYALVNKKPKKVPNRMKINQNPNKVQADYENIEKEKKTIKLEIDRIVGPKGDNYTLVNKC